MKVILSQDVKAQGKKGQLINVSDGYARNFLLPKGLAIEANDHNVNIMKSQQEAKKHHVIEELDKAKDLAKAIQAVKVTIPAKAGTSGRLFGAVTSKEIAEEMMKQNKIEIDKKKIVLEEPIKTIGDHTLDVKLHPEVVAKIHVVITPVEVII